MYANVFKVNGFVINIMFIIGYVLLNYRLVTLLDLISGFEIQLKQVWGYAPELWAIVYTDEGRNFASPKWRSWHNNGV